MEEMANITTPAEYKDRRGGLIAFGILQIILGLMCLLILAGMVFTLLLNPELFTTLTPRMIGFVMATYALTALVLIWLGIGSILCRRWARVLALIGAWSVLFMGILVLLFYGLLGRKVFAGLLPDEIATFALIFSMVFIAVFFVALPGAMVIFYGGRNVVATCMMRDPHTRWTDRCPMPVLGTSIWLALGSLSLLIMPICYRSVVPWFGALMSGTPATLVLTVLMVIGFYLAWGVYRLQMAAWWISLAVFTIFSLSAVATFMKVDFLEFYRELGYTPEQLDLLRNYSFLTGSIMAWWMGICSILFIVFLVWLRKYFPKQKVG